MSVTTTAPASTVHAGFTAPYPLVRSALDALGAVAPSRPPVPILSHARITRDGADAVLTATDYNMFLSLRLPGAAAGGSRATIVPIAALGAYLRAATKGDRKTQTDQYVVEFDGDQHTVTAAGCTVPTDPYPGSTPDEFPDMPPIGEPAAVLSGEEFVTALGRVASSADRGDSVPVLRSVHLSVGKREITVTATDRYRLAVATVGANTCATVDAVLPVEFVDLLMRHLGDEERVTIHSSSTHVTVTTPHRTFTTRVVEGEYPRVSRIVSERGDTSATMALDAFKRAVVKAHAVSLTSGRNQPVDVIPDGETVVVTPMTDDQSRTRGIAVPATGDGMVPVRVSGKYLTDALAVFSGASTVRVDTTATDGLDYAHKPILLTSDDVPGVRVVVQPVRAH